jgi:hypothetical protein
VLKAREQRSNQKDAVAQIERDGRSRRVGAALPRPDRTRFGIEQRRIEGRYELRMLERRHRDRRLAVRCIVAYRAGGMRAGFPEHRGRQRAMRTGPSRRVGFDGGRGVPVRAVHRSVLVRRLRLLVDVSGCCSVRAGVLFARRRRRGHREARRRLKADRSEREQSQDESTKSRSAPSKDTEDVAGRPHWLSVAGRHAQVETAAHLETA